MTNLYEIIQYLKTIPELAAQWKGSNEDQEKLISGFNTDQAARTGELAWLSVKHVSQERVRGFRGSMLIAPEGIEARGKPVLVCKKPKLAFILAVRKFFSDSASIRWPDRDGEINPAVREVSTQASLGPGVVIGSGVRIAEGVVIGPNSVLANCTVEKNVVIGANCSIGLPGFGYEKDEDGRYWRFPHTGGVLLEQDVEIGSNTCIDRGSIGDTIIGRGSKVDNLVHIAHNVLIGANSIIIANSMLGGSVQIEEQSWVAPSAAIMNQVKIGRGAVIGLGAVVLKDVEDFSVMVGNPARLLRKNEEEN